MTVLSGTATALSIVGGLSAGASDAQQLESQAGDARLEAQNETVRGLERRRAIRQAAGDADADIGLAYAASGIDLTFGTPVEARRAAFAEARRALNTDVATQQSRASRLMQRSDLFRRQANRRRRASVISGLVQGTQFATDALERG
jgi:hypothetical protein